MDAESMKNQEQLNIKDNETLPVEKSDDTKLCKVDSSTVLSSKSADNIIDSCTEVVSTSMQTSTDSYGNGAPCQSDNQYSHHLHNPTTIDIDSKADDAAGEKSQSVLELSDDYLTQMMKNVNDREIGLYEGVFFKSDETENSKVCSDHAEIQNLLSVQETLVPDVSNEIDNSITHDKIEITVENTDSTRNTDEKEKVIAIDNAHVEEVDNHGNIDKNDSSRQTLLSSMELLIVDEANSSNQIKETEKDSQLEKIEIVERNNDTMVNLDMNEKPVLTDNALVEEDEKKYIDKSVTNQQDVESTGEHFIVDKSNDFNDINESEREVHSQNSDKLESTNVDIDKSPSNDGKVPVATLECTDIKKGFSRHELKDIDSTVESKTLINSMQRLEWLKHPGGGMEGNRRKLSRKPSIDTEVCQDVKSIREEPTEDAKLSSKSSKKRSSQSKSRKAKAVDAPKQDISQDRNKKSSGVRPANTSKNENSKSTNVRAVEKSKDAKNNSPILELPRSSIGRGRNDRRKVSGYPQQKAQSNINDQWNNTPTDCLEIPTEEEKNYNRDKAHSNAGGSSVEVEATVEKVEDFTENIVVSDSSKSKTPEVCEKEIQSKLSNQSDSSVFLHNQLSTKNNENEPSIQKNEEQIDIKKEQLPSVKIDQDSQNKLGKNLSSRPIFGRSTDESNFAKISLTYKGFGQNKHDSNKQENCSTNNTNFYSTSTNVPRWNYNDSSDRQNFGLNSAKGFTSNKHRNITEDENKQNEESFGKDQALPDRYQGNKGYFDKSHDSRTSGDRYNGRSHDNRHYNYQYSDRNQDHRNYNDRNSTRNQDGRSYSDIVSDRNQNSQGDRYFLNQNNRGFGKDYSERFQDKANGDRYSDKVRDSKNITNRYPDRNQQSKTSYEISGHRGHDGNQMTTKKQEPLNRNPVSFDKNNDRDKYQDIKNSSNKSLNSAKETLSKSQVHPKDQDINENYGRKNQDTSSNGRHICDYHKKNQEMMESYQNQFWETPEDKDYDNVKQTKSDVKSQKHYDNTQQVKVQKGLQQLHQSFSSPSAAHQSEISSSVDQNFKLHEKVVHSADFTNTQPIQSGDWTSHKNISKQGADFRCASPYANTNVTVNPTVTNEYVSQCNETLLNSSNQFSSVSNAAAPEQKPNVVMSFAGNQNVQRALGIDIDPSHFIQNQSAQANTNDLFRSNPSSPASQQVSTSANAAQFYESITSDLKNPPTTLAYTHSTMNVNALPFEVSSNQKSNDQLMYVQSAISKSRAGFITTDDNDRFDSVTMNIISNNSEKQLRLSQEISELSKQLAIKQAELMNLQMKMAEIYTRAGSNQLINPSFQQITDCQQQNQPLSSNYVQGKHSNVPPGFQDVSLNVKSTQMNLYEMSTNVAQVQNYPVQKFPSNIVLESRINAEPVYLAQGTIYRQQATNYQMYTDKTANSAAHNIVPQTAEQRQISGGIQFSKQ